MRILLVDCRSTDSQWGLRANQITGVLRSAHHTVDIQPHIVKSAPGNPAVLSTSWDHYKDKVLKEAGAYDLIILHVGESQYGAEEALKWSYRDKPVLCFTGGYFPRWCQEDCSTNWKHCCLPEALGQGVEDSVLERICKYVAVVDGAERLGTGTLARDLFEQACAQLAGYNAAREKALETLYGGLSKLAGEEGLDGNGIAELTKLRDQLLGTEEAC